MSHWGQNPNYGAPQHQQQYPPQPYNNNYNQPPPPGPPQGFPNQGYPNQGYPNQGYPNQGFSNQAYPNQGYGPPQGQYGGPGYNAPPAPPSPGYIPGQQSQMDMSRAADDLRSAMKGFGTNEEALIHILAPMGPLEVNSVKAAYHARHHRDLMKDIHSETSGHFRETLLAICRGPLDQDCHVLRNALEGVGTKEHALDDVLLARSNADLEAIKRQYHHLYKRSAEADVRADLSMKTERLFDMVLSARRADENSPVIPQQIENDVRDIYGATEGRTGTDQITVCAILTARSDAQIRAIAQAYQQRYHRTLNECLRKEFSGHMEHALCYIVRQAEDPAKHDADLFEDAMKGMGTNDQALIRRTVAVHWNRARLQQAKAAYRHFYKRELVDRIRGETSGDYRRILVIFETP